MQDTYLAHYGKEGMKWYQRKGPPYPLDKSPQKQAAKKRKAEHNAMFKIDNVHEMPATKTKRSLRSMSDDELQATVKRKNLENAYKKVTNSESKLETVNSVFNSSEQAINRSKNIIKKIPDAPKERMDLSGLTDKEMRERINRELLERQYDQIFNTNTNKVNTGKRIALDTLDLVGDVAAIGLSVTGLILAVRKLKGV